jgi:hypothetical protein
LIVFSDNNHFEVCPLSLKALANLQVLLFCAMVEVVGEIVQ